MTGGGGGPADAVSARDRERLTPYVDRLLHWGRRLDLVGPSVLADPWPLVLESLQARPADPARHLLDIGSGGGLPAIPLLVVGAASRGTLVEPRERRWAFLVRVVRELGLEAEVVCGRWQEIGRRLPPPDLVTSRALAGASGWLEELAPGLAAGARAALFGARNDQVAVAGWRETGSRLLPSGARLRMLAREAGEGVPRGTSGEDVAE